MAVNYDEKRQGLLWLQNAVLNDDVRITDYQKLYDLVVNGSGVNDIKEAISRYQVEEKEPVSHEKFEDTVMFYAHSLEEILRKDPFFRQNGASEISKLTTQINNLGNNYIVSHLYNQLLSKKQTCERELASIKVGYDHVVSSQAPSKEQSKIMIELLGNAIKKQEEISKLETKINAEKSKYDAYISGFNIENKITDFLRDTFLVNRTLWNMNLSRETKDAIDNLYRQTQEKVRLFNVTQEKDTREIENLCNAAGLTFSANIKNNAYVEAELIKEEPIFEEPLKTETNKSEEIKYRYNGIIPPQLSRNQNYKRLVVGQTYTFDGYFNNIPKYITLKEVPGAMFSVDSFDKVKDIDFKVPESTANESSAIKNEEDNITEVVGIAPEINELASRMAERKEMAAKDSIILEEKEQKEEKTNDNYNIDDMLQSFQSIVDEFNNQINPQKEPEKKETIKEEKKEQKPFDAADLYMNREDLHKDEQGIRDYQDRVMANIRKARDEFRKSRPNPYEETMNAMTDEKIKDRRNFMIGDQIMYNNFRPVRFVHVNEYQILKPGQTYTFITYKDSSRREVMLEEIPGIYFSVDSFDLVKTKDNKPSYSYVH